MSPTTPASVIKPKGSLTSARQTAGWDRARLMFFLVVTLGTLLLFGLSPSLLPSALISVLLYFIFGPLIDMLERQGVSRSAAIGGLFLVIGAVLTIGITSVLPRITEEAKVLQRFNSEGASVLTAKLQAQEDKLLGSHGKGLFKDVALSKKAMAWVQQSAGKIWAVVPDLASQVMMLFFLVPFLTFVLLKDGREIQRSLLRLVPNRYFETTYSIMFKIMDGMGGFVSARIIEAALVAGLVGLGCVAVNVPYALLLGIFAGATNPIPYLGPLIGALPGVLLAIMDPTIPNELVWVVVIYVIANLIDMIVIFPVVVAKIVDLHPVVVVLCVILGSQFFGIVGMIMAVPVTSILKIFIQELYSRLYTGNRYFPNEQ